MKTDPLRPRALVVDDDPGVLAFMTDVLQEAGWEAVAATRGDVVLDRCRQIRPLLVLMDVLMPGADGFTVLAQIRADSEFEDIDVVLVSGEPTEIHGEIARRLGALEFLEKPTSVDAIRSVLDSVRRKRDAEVPEGVES